MRRAVVAGATVVVTALSGCGTDWFGNEPAPTTQPDPACAARRVAEPAPFDPVRGGVPPAVPPGWRWVAITLRVHAIEVGPDADNVELCVPIGIHVYGRVQGGPPVTVIDGGVPRPLPYDARKLTPWTTSYMVIAYDPESPRFAVPPPYEVELIATYERDRDNARGSEPPPTSIRCGIGISGSDVSSQYASVLRDGRLSVRCTVKQSLYLGS